ncbi:hypothetical protein D3C76_1087650 [compost metagenome]
MNRCHFCRTSAISAILPPSVLRDQRNFLREPLAGLNDEPSITRPDLCLAAGVFLCRTALVVHPLRRRTAHHAGGGQPADQATGGAPGFSPVSPACPGRGTERRRPAIGHNRQRGLRQHRCGIAPAGRGHDQRHAAGAFDPFLPEQMADAAPAALAAALSGHSVAPGGRRQQRAVARRRFRPGHRPQRRQLSGPVIHSLARRADFPGLRPEPVARASAVAWPGGPAAFSVAA